MGHDGSSLKVFISLKWLLSCLIYQLTTGMFLASTYWKLSSWREMIDFTVSGLLDLGCCCAMQLCVRPALSHQVCESVAADSCTAVPGFLLCCLSLSGSRSPSVWGFLSVLDVGMLLEVSAEGTMTDFSIMTYSNDNEERSEYSRWLHEKEVCLKALLLFWLNCAHELSKHWL